MIVVKRGDFARLMQFGAWLVHPHHYLCVLSHRQRKALSLRFHSMGANEHLQDAIQRSRSEGQAPKDTPTDQVEITERRQQDQQQPHRDTE